MILAEKIVELENRIKYLELEKNKADEKIANLQENVEECEKNEQGFTKEKILELYKEGYTILFDDEIWNLDIDDEEDYEAIKNYLLNDSERKVCDFQIAIIPKDVDEFYSMVG